MAFRNTLSFLPISNKSNPAVLVFEYAFRVDAADKRRVKKVKITTPSENSVA